MALGFERWTANQKLIAEDSEAPQIHLLIVCFTLNHLWRKIVQRTAQRRPPDRQQQTHDKHKNTKLRETPSSGKQRDDELHW